MILGIDDAGRGPVIGPMVLAGCLIDKETEKEFKDLGIKDSKQLTPRRREMLAKLIKEKSESFEIQISTADQIDSSLNSGTNLNQLEAIKTAKIIDKLNKTNEKIKVVIDCPSTNINSWTDYLKTKIENLSNLEISCEHKADRNHVVVSAASIIAKSKRESEMDKLREKFPDMGSGYSSDPLTIKFLEKNYSKHADKGIFRKTWATYKKFSPSPNQKKLDF